MLRREQLHPYQLKIVNFIEEKAKAMLMVKMGLGKTVSSLTAFYALKYESFEINTALVIAPKRVVNLVWKQEVQKWEHLQGLRIVRVIGTAKQRRAALRQPADIHVVGRDVVEWLVAEMRGDMTKWDMLIIDEISSFKNPGSKRFKALRLVINQFKRVVGLTGTPAPNSLLDLWSQIFLIDQGERLGRFISHYRNEFFVPNSGRGQGGRTFTKYALKKNGEAAIYDRISDISLSLGLENLDMPDLVEVDVMVELSPAKQKEYKRFKRESYLRILEEAREKELVAMNAAVLTGKLLQFANGAVYDQNRNVINVHDEKLAAVEELIDEANGNNVLILYNYQHDRDKLLKKLSKRGAVVMTDEIVPKWNKGEVPIMLMHPKSGGHGVNLQGGAHTMIWYGMTWSLEDYSQTVARLYRQGQVSETVSVFHILTAGTMDERVMKIIKGKHQGQEALMSALKTELKDVLG
jgi:SNF2 family DNA or RNA helicase